MEQDIPHFTPEAATDEPASSPNLAGFEPVPVRARHDGWTPQKQRGFLEALAETGLIREAAARVGMTEQSVSRLRRRPDAHVFDLLCEAARRPGAQRIHAIAWERAIEGTIKRHYYHGELKSEERVFNDRLLMQLVGMTASLVEPPAEAALVHKDWDGWMTAVEQGLDEPPPKPWDGSEVWRMDDERWWTSFPPPAGFTGEMHGELGSFGYRRTLSDAEEAAMDAIAERKPDPSTCRDLYFGFEGGDFFPSRTPNL
jgi:hypothetical protein